MEILAEHARLRAEDRLALLICVNHGFAGGDAARQLAEQYREAAQPSVSVAPPEDLADQPQQPGRYERR